MRRTRLTRGVMAGASALGIGGLVALPGVLPAAAGTHVPQVTTFRPGRALYDVGVHTKLTRAQVLHAAAAASTFTQYKYSVTVSGHTYNGVIAGKNPSKKVTNPASTVSTLLVPLVMNFGGGLFWDPTLADSCDHGASALTRTKNSAIFKSHSWTWGGTAIGTAQLTGAFQRAEFWKYTRPTGINPGYNLTFKLTTHAPVVINVPASWGPATSAITCGNGFVGAVDINHLDAYLRSTVIPSLRIGPATVPIFLVHNFVEYVGTTANCCVLGYHNAYNTTRGIQTYSFSIYDNSRAFKGSSDISALTHEMGEWANDPYTNNRTPSWGHIGQVSGCQANLEVGDPLSGTTFTDKVGGFTYHPQELAFFSWFYHQSPSLGVHGWYSNQGEFKTFAASCH